MEKGDKIAIKEIATAALDAVKSAGIGFVVTAAVTTLAAPKGKMGKLLTVIGAGAIGAMAAKAAHEKNDALVTEMATGIEMASAITKPIKVDNLPEEEKEE